MSEHAKAYPLQWPTSRPRTLTGQRMDGRFHARKDTGASYRHTRALTIAEAVDRLQRELDMLGAVDVVLSSNLQLRLDGPPRSGQGEPADPGVALYFTLKKKPHCLPCDRYSKVAQNIAALAAHIDATRAIERYGVASVTEMFTGFTALPDPGKAKSWRDVLGFPPDRRVELADIERRYRELANIHHPDKGGDGAVFVAITAARDAARQAVA